jgi:hypothetical protein
MRDRILGPITIFGETEPYYYVNDITLVKLITNKYVPYTIMDRYMSRNSFFQLLTDYLLSHDEQPPQLFEAIAESGDSDLLSFLPIEKLTIDVRDKIITTTMKCVKDDPIYYPFDKMMDTYSKNYDKKTYLRSFDLSTANYFLMLINNYSEKAMYFFLKYHKLLITPNKYKRIDISFYLIYGEKERYRNSICKLHNNCTDVEFLNKNERLIKFTRRILDDNSQISILIEGFRNSNTSIFKYLAMIPKKNIGYISLQSYLHEILNVFKDDLIKYDCILTKCFDYAGDELKLIKSSKISWNTYFIYIMNNSHINFDDNFEYRLKSLINIFDRLKIHPQHRFVISRKIINHFKHYYIDYRRRSYQNQENYISPLTKLSSKLQAAFPNSHII